MIYKYNGCGGLTSVYISDLAAWCKIKFGYAANPLSVAQHLYLNGKEIKDLAIPNGVTSIGARAFYGYSGLTSVTIPNSVTSIGEYAFYACSSLTSVHCKSSTPPHLSYDAFYYTPEQKTLYVPIGASSAYQASDWGIRFSQIVEE